MIGLIGRKLGMGQIFAADGTLVPVTIIQAGPCTVVQKKDLRTRWLHCYSAWVWHTQVAACE